MRGPKTDAAIRSRVDQIIAQNGAEEWITVEVKWDAVERFKAAQIHARGRPDLVEEEHAHLVFDVLRVHCTDGCCVIERGLRQKMAEKKIACSLPEGRASKTPTIEQVLGLF
jgi:hypothetical protein